MRASWGVPHRFLRVLRQVDEAEEGHIGQSGRGARGGAAFAVKAMSPSVSPRGVKKLVRMGRSRSTATSTLAVVRDTARCTYLRLLQRPGCMVSPST